MTTETKGRELVGYCGIYCGACAIKNGQIAGAAKTLKSMLDAYEYSSWVPMAAEHIPAIKPWPEFEGVLSWLTAQDCAACGGGGGNPGCEIRLCAKQKGLEGCWACDEQRGCEKLAPFEQGYPGLSSNRARIAEAGVEAWMDEQAKEVAGGFSYLAAKQKQG